MGHYLFFLASLQITMELVTSCIILILWLINFPADQALGIYGWHKGSRITTKVFLNLSLSKQSIMYLIERICYVHKMLVEQVDTSIMVYALLVFVAIVYAVREIVPSQHLALIHTALNVHFSPRCVHGRLVVENLWRRIIDRHATYVLSLDTVLY